MPAPARLVGVPGPSDTVFIGPPMVITTVFDGAMAVFPRCPKALLPFYGFINSGARLPLFFIFPERRSIKLESSYTESLETLS